MGSCLGTEKGDPSLAPWKGPKGLYPGEKFFSGKCHGARTVTQLVKWVQDTSVGTSPALATRRNVSSGARAPGAHGGGGNRAGCFLCLDGVWGPGGPCQQQWGLWSALGETSFQMLAILCSLTA